MFSVKISNVLFLFKKSFAKNGLSRKTTEWILHFHGENQELSENYFQIGSGYAESEYIVEKVSTQQLLGRDL